MNVIAKMLLGFIVFCAPLCAGYYLGSSDAESTVESNSFKGFHCQPITEHKTLEEAKARIEQYQAMVRG